MFIKGRTSGFEDQVERKSMLIRLRAELQDLKAEWKIKCNMKLKPGG